MSDERLVELKGRAAARLMAIPGVTGVGLGGRERAGRPTGEIVLKVFVERKRPLAELTPGQRLPTAFEGLGVDVSELSPARLHRSVQVDDPPEPPLAVGSPGTSAADTDLRRYRPLIGGANLLADMPGAWWGTLGCLLTHATDPGKVYALTAFHLFARTPTDPLPVVNVTQVGQPDAKDSPTKCCSNLIGAFAGGGLDEIRDSALIQLDAGTKWLAEIIGIGPVKGTHTVTLDEAATLTYQVSKRGARTGLTGGTVVSINTTATTGEGVTRHNLMVVTPNPSNPPAVPLFFAEGGDSGSAVLNDASEVVGVHLAGSVTGDVRKGFELPIDAVLAQFQAKEGLPLTVATAAAPGLENVVPGAHAVAASAAELPAQAGGLPAYPELLGQVGVDLDGSAAGRRLLALWLDHHEELLTLVNEQRRVTIAWHRGGGPALLQTLVRTVADPALPVPHTVNGEPPARRMNRIYAAFHAAASPKLRRALDQARAGLPDPASLTYPQILAALAAV